MAVIKQGGNTIKVCYVTDLTGVDGKVIKKNVKGNMVMNLTDIMVVDVCYTNKGQNDDNKCRIFHEQLGWMTLNETFEEMSHLKMDGTIQVKGFIQKVNRKINNKLTNKTKYGKSSKRNNRNS